MVRRDPMNERGPMPASGRPKPPRKIPRARTLFELSPLSEYEKLWTCALEGAQVQVELLEGYRQLGMPGYPKGAALDLLNRLAIILRQQEETT